MAGKGIDPNAPDPDASALVDGMFPWEREP